MINRDNLLKSFVGMPTTEVVVKLGEHDDTISQLSQELGVGDRTSTQNVAAPMSAPETKPSVPTMTEPIPEYSQPEEQSGNSDPDAIQEPRQAPYSNPYDIPDDYNPNDYVYADEQTPVYTNPYDIPGTDEQEKSKWLSDATIERDNLLKSFVGMPTTEDVLQLGEYDDAIQRLTQQLGLGQKEYTPGVEGGDIGEIALQGVHFGGSMLDEEDGVPQPGPSPAPNDYSIQENHSPELEPMPQQVPGGDPYYLKAKEMEGKSYMTEAEAAVAFAESAVPETGKDVNERVAIIINMEVPVINQDGKVVYEKRYVLGTTLVGEHDNVIGELAGKYASIAPWLLATGNTVSFVHTHPNCTCHIGNKLSGEEGKTGWDITEEVARNILTTDTFGDFGKYLGDVQVPWLPGVERMYLASPIEGKIYACDANGPIYDTTNPNDYFVAATFTNVITTPPFTP